MYFYRKRTPTGEVLQLLEAFRDATGRACNRVVVSLGRGTLAEAQWATVAKAVEARLYGQWELWPLAGEAAAWCDRIVKRVERQARWTPLAERRQPLPAATGDPSELVDGVLIDRLEHQHETTLGPELVGWHAWRTLQLDGLLDRLGFNAAQRVAAAVAVLNRLVEPVSEHGLLNWLPTSSLADLLGEEVYGSDERYYRVGDQLLAAQTAIEAQLQAAVQTHFGLSRTLVLYDLTNTHFEGVCAANPKAQRGANKQKRLDCPQVVVGVCFDECGFVLCHQTFPGNTREACTLATMLGALEKRVGTAGRLAAMVKPLVIMDAGLATAANRQWLQTAGYRYLVNETRAGRQAYAAAFQEEKQFALVPGREGRTQVSVRLLTETHQVAGQPVAERVVLCRSVERREKEAAMLSRAETRFLAALKKLATRVKAGRLKRPAGIQQAIGRLRQRHPRAARYYDVRHDRATAAVVYDRQTAAYAAAQALHGCYVLRTNDVQAPLTGAELWSLYMSLATAENGFKALKSDLGLRPNHHQIERRVDAHVFITILAYQLQRFITYTLETGGDRRQWDTLLLVLRTHCYATLLVPTRDGACYRLRRPGLAEECQREVYRQLGVDLRGLPRSKVRLPAGSHDFVVAKKSGR